MIESTSMRLKVEDKSGESNRTIPIGVVSYGDDIEIKPQGYSDINGSGCPILVELWNGELRVIVWGDINQEDPTHIISLEGAKEEKRQ